MTNRPQPTPDCDRLQPVVVESVPSETRLLSGRKSGRESMSFEPIDSLSLSVDSFPRDRNRAADEGLFAIFCQFRRKAAEEMKSLLHPPRIYSRSPDARESKAAFSYGGTNWQPWSEAVISEVAD
jgi:hypothetical protein